MGVFIALLDYTDQGIREIKDSPHRADRFNAMAERAGVKILAQYWTIGSHDGVLVMEAPNDEVAASILLALGAEGNVRTTTLRAFEWAEAQGLIERSD
ncbi:MAG TPA: GYD domain-containing protein [Candidatus Polarisedimenticolaceae bacterium]|nr:GYD domain-containing protein [Candidatus Polarisedimenticolaceae bacterium]